MLDNEDEIPCKQGFTQPELEEKEQKVFDKAMNLVVEEHWKDIVFNNPGSQS